MKRFWKHVDSSDATGCWPWTRATYPTGYGVFRFEGKNVRAHRMAYSLAKGDIGDKFVLHTCDNRLCCNPAHLFLGSQADNIADMWQKGRGYSGGGPRGEAHSQSKLTTLQVFEIRRRLESGDSARSLAREYRVSSTTINNIRHRRIWI